MKKLLLLLLFPLIAFAQTPVRFTAFSVTNAGTTAERIITTNASVLTGATFYALKDGAVSNSAAIFIGPSTNGVTHRLAPGENVTLFVQPGTQVNLKDWWLKGSANDGVTVVYR